MTLDAKMTEILEAHPYLSYGIMLDVHYVGVIQNSDNQLLSMYILDAIPADIRKSFLDMCETWWWGSNRQIPVNIFIGPQFREFRPYLKHFSRKDFQLLAGPAVSLQETIARRVRKRQVTLIRRPD